jgi:hypothetical protein
MHASMGQRSKWTCDGIEHLNEHGSGPAVPRTRTTSAHDDTRVARGARSVSSEKKWSFAFTHPTRKKTRAHIHTHTHTHTNDGVRVAIGAACGWPTVFGEESEPKKHENSQSVHTHAHTHTHTMTYSVRAVWAVVAKTNALLKITE